MATIRRFFILACSLAVLLATPALTQAWSIGTHTKSDTDPGTAGVSVTIGTNTATTIRPGQTFTVTGRYIHQDLSGSGANTRITGAYLMFHHVTLKEWLYLYVHRVNQTPSTFTGWAYSPYAGTARGTDAEHLTSQRITADSEMPLGQSSRPVIVPTAANARVMLTATRPGFTVKGVRTFVSNDQVNTEWQLAWEPTATLPAFPEGTIDVYSSVEAGSTYDGWDRFGSFQLQR